MYINVKICCMKFSKVKKSYIKNNSLTTVSTKGSGYLTCSTPVPNTRILPGVVGQGSQGDLLQYRLLTLLLVITQRLKANALLLKTHYTLHTGLRII